VRGAQRRPRGPIGHRKGVKYVVTEAGPGNCTCDVVGRQESGAHSAHLFGEARAKHSSAAAPLGVPSKRFPSRDLFRRSPGNQVLRSYL
jgi:hypothetical protein